MRFKIIVISLAVIFTVMLTADSVSSNFADDEIDRNSVADPESDLERLLSSPKMHMKRRHHRKKKKNWYKTMNNITRHHGKQLAKGFQRYANFTHKHTMNLTNEFYNIFNRLHGNQLPIKKLVSRMPKILGKLSTDQVADTVRVINDVASNLTTYFQDSLNDLSDRWRILKFRDRSSSESDEDKLPNFFYGFGDVISDILDNLMGSMSGSSRSRYHSDENDSEYED